MLSSDLKTHLSVNEAERGSDFRAIAETAEVDRERVTTVTEQLLHQTLTLLKTKDPVKTDRCAFSTTSTSGVEHTWAVSRTNQHPVYISGGLSAVWFSARMKCCTRRTHTVNITINFMHFHQHWQKICNQTPERRWLVVSVLRHTQRRFRSHGLGSLTTSLWDVASDHAGAHKRL